MNDTLRKLPAYRCDVCWRKWQDDGMLTTVLCLELLVRFGRAKDGTMLEELLDPEFEAP